MLYTASAREKAHVKEFSLSFLPIIDLYRVHRLGLYLSTQKRLPACNNLYRES